MKERSPPNFPILDLILLACEGVPAKEISLSATKHGLKLSSSTLYRWRADPDYCRPSFEKLATLLYVLGLMFEVTDLITGPKPKAKSNKGRSVHSVVTRH